DGQAVAVVAFEMNYPGDVDLFAERFETTASMAGTILGLALTKLCLGRRTVTRIIWTNGGQHRSWSPEYHLLSRSPWHPQSLFTPILSRGLAYCKQRYVGVAVDDTGLRKTGRLIPHAFFQRDPLSPPFRVNLMWGVRFLQASLLVPIHRCSPVGTRALPIRFEMAPVVKRPKRKAPAEEWKRFRLARKQRNLSQLFVTLARELRATFDRLQASSKILVFAVDGSFCNRTVFALLLAGVHIVARARKDAVLCFRAPAGSRRFYAPDKFTPEQVRQNDNLAWKTTRIFYGGKRRRVRYKEVPQVYWQGGARRRLLRLLVVAPTPYRKRKSGRLYYRQPAYLLTTALTASARTLLQIYFDRWQIEVNHREEKDTLGIGQAQLWNVNSVPRQPVLAVAAYAALLLASLLTFGPTRTDAYAALPKWRRKAKRPSCLDLITLLWRQ
ncbi:MAG: transposase, partial [Candidatus Methanoperedens sp.]|nr:transposase [Candidatus Methanoperedens sp.]